jgi:hypothetical protein
MSSGYLEKWWWTFATSVAALDAAQESVSLGLDKDNVVAVAPSWIGVETTISDRSALLPARIEWREGLLFNPKHAPTSLTGRYVSVRESGTITKVKTGYVPSGGNSRACRANGDTVMLDLLSVEELIEAANDARWLTLLPLIEAMCQKTLPRVIAGVGRELGVLHNRIMDDVSREQLLSDYVLGGRVSSLLDRASALNTYAKVDPYTATRVAVRRDLREALYSKLGDSYRGSMIRDFARSEGLSDPAEVAAKLSGIKHRVVTTKTAANALALPKTIYTTTPIDTKYGY